MPDLKMLNSTKYLYKLTFIKCSYEHPDFILSSFRDWTRRYLCKTAFFLPIYII